MRDLSVVALTVMFLLTTGGAVASDLTPGPDRTISAQEMDEYLPQVAYNSVRDEYLVVWHDVSPIQARSIMGQRLDHDGNFIDQFVIAFEDSPPRDNAQATVAYDPFHDLYLVAWVRDFYGDGSDWDVYGRIVPATGPSPTHDTFAICTFNSIQWSPRIAFATLQSEFLVTWTNEANGGVAGYISAQRVTASGTLMDGNFTVASGTGERVNPDVAYNAESNEYLVVFQRMDTGAGDVYGVRIGPGGAILGGGEFAIAGWPDPELTPRVAASKTLDEWAVVWESTVAGNHTDIYARRLWVDGGGTVQFAAPVPVKTSIAHENAPDIAGHPAGTEYLIAWEQQYSSSTGPYGIHARTLDLANTSGPESTIRPVYTGYQVDSSTPSIAASRFDYFVTWRQERLDGSYQDIHGNAVAGPLFADSFETGGPHFWDSWR